MMRRIPFTTPINRPYLYIAMIIYVEQVGVKRQRDLTDIGAKAL